ncbi:DUF6478 family protein [Sedimentitalea sp. HM32M-2]|uniref:DUF6478 family protein n=1 Tax=Sedimentitalea sp. HM32M-2 TaxID=3351566 RepID=UPI00363BD543
MVGILDRLRHAGSLRHWRRAAGHARKTPLAALRHQRAQARALRTQLDRLIDVADSRLAAAVIVPGQKQPPHGTDWSWRPDPWCRPLPVPGTAGAPKKLRLCDQITLFHDCDLSELTLRQIANPPSQNAPPLGLQLDVFRFHGSFLSLAIDLPPQAAEGLSRAHVLRLDLAAETETPLKFFARLNVLHGPNTDKLVRELPQTGQDMHMEYDLAYSNMNEKRIDRLWLDLILEAPAMNRVILRDLTLTRRRRAAL